MGVSPVPVSPSLLSIEIQIEIQIQIQIRKSNQNFFCSEEKIGTLVELLFCFFVFGFVFSLCASFEHIDRFVVDAL